MSMYTVDAKELLKQQDDDIRKVRQEKGENKQRTWVPDSKAKAAPPLSEDEKILRRLNAEQAAREKRAEERDVLAKFEREGPSMPPEPETDPLS